LEIDGKSSENVSYANASIDKYKLCPVPSEYQLRIGAKDSRERLL